MSNERWPLTKRTVSDWVHDYWLVSIIGFIVGTIIGCAFSW